MASHSSAQDISTTGDLITNQGSAWTGCYTPTQQGFWGGTSGGPCPGIWTNNEPYNENQIIFSYGQTTLSQTQSLATALPNSGTGLQVNGYNWHWHVKNSNINDKQPGSYDSTAYVTVDLLSATGAVLESDVYNYGYRITDWINPSGTRTYDNPYSLTNADSIRLSVTGKDSGNWAGYYGPEFMHFSLSVNYSVDPCASNPLHSPTCSGYMDALAALMPQSAEPTSTEPTVTVESSIPTAEVIASSPTPVAVTSQSPTPTVTTTAQSSSRNVGSGLSIGSILSIVRNEQSRISSVESSAVQQANEQAALATADAQQQAETVASSADQQAIDQATQAAAVTQQQSESVSSPAIQQAIEQALRPPTNTQQQSESVESSELASNQSQLEIEPTQSQETNIEVTNNSSQNTNEMYSLSKRTEAEPTSESISVTGNSPTGNLFESTPVIVQEQNTQTTESTVNSNVADNDIAGEVSITGLQVVPNGFDLYQIGLIDVSFYKPKDIYKNQKNVDNARAFRNLSSDRLHQRMIDQQYER